MFVQGGMSTIFFNSKAIKIFVVTNGAGQLEMACPHLAQEQQGKDNKAVVAFRRANDNKATEAHRSRSNKKKSSAGEDYQSDGSDED